MFIASIIPAWLTEILAFVALVLSIYNTMLYIITAKKEKDPTKRRQLAWIIVKLKTPMTPEELFLKHWDEPILNTQGEVISSSQPPKKPSPSEGESLITYLASEYRLTNECGKWRAI